MTAYYKIETITGELVWEGEAESANDARAKMELNVYEKLSTGVEQAPYVFGLAEYAKKWGHHEASNNFAVACFDMNTYQELVSALNRVDPDPVDVSAWDLQPGEWSDAIMAAMNEKSKAHGDDCACGDCF